MLVLTRKPGESVFIGDGIEVRIEEVDGNNVRLGIRAPKELTVYRGEIHEEIKEANLQALRSASAGNLQQTLSRKGRKGKGKGKKR